nr:hypothetical protein [Ochrobactrum sp. CM-21-5]
MTLIDRLSKLEGPDREVDAVTATFERCAKSFTGDELTELVKFCPVIAYGIALLRAKEARKL